MSFVPAKVSTQFIFYASLVSQANTKLMQVNPTIASGDFKVSIDGGALANLGTLPAVTPAGSAMVKFTLSTSEMAGANATVVCSDAAGSEWCDLTINIPTASRQIDDLAFPTVSGRSLDVTSNGNAGIDWGNIENATTSNALTGTSIITSQKVDVDTIKTNPVVNGGTITFPTNATVASTTNITAGTITTVTTTTTATNVTNAPTNGDFTAVMKTSIGTAVAASAVASVTGAVGSVTGAVGSVTGNVGGNVTGSVGSVVGAVGSVTGAVGSVTGNVGGNVVGSVGSVTGLTAANLDAAVSSRLATAGYTAPDNAGIAAIQLKTDALPENIALGQPYADFPFSMVLAADHVTPATGLTVTATVSIDGGVFASTVNDPVEVGNGVYVLDLDGADTNGVFLVFQFAAATADTTTVNVKTADIPT